MSHNIIQATLIGTFVISLGITGFQLIERPTVSQPIASSQDIQLTRQYSEPTPSQVPAPTPAQSQQQRQTQASTPQQSTASLTPVRSEVTPQDQSQSQTPVTSQSIPALPQTPASQPANDVVEPCQSTGLVSTVVSTLTDLLRNDHC